MNLAILAYNVEFQGRRRKPENMDPPKKKIEPQKYDTKGLGLSVTAKKLFVALDDQIEDDWAEIKNGNKLDDCPRYMFSDKHGFMSIRPIYGGVKPAVLFELGNDKYTERYIFNRSNPEIFRYEKTVLTDYGSATLKSFNSEVEKNNAIMQQADDIIMKYVPKILSEKKQKIYFGKVNGAKKDVVKVVI